MLKNKNKFKANIALFVIGLVLFTDVFLFAAEACSSKGIVQYKPDGICSTQSRTCCDSGYFSEWNKPCPIVDKKKECENNGGCWNGSVCKTGYYFDYKMGPRIKKERGETCMQAFYKKLESDNWANVPAGTPQCNSSHNICNLCGTAWECYNAPVIVYDNTNECELDTRYRGCHIN